MLTNTKEEQENKQKGQGEVVLSVKNLLKAFGDNVVIDHVSFDLHKKENIAILGKSGTGKSVLIKTIVGLHELDGGELTVLGEKMSQLDEDTLNEMRTRIGYLFQGGALYDSMTVRENLKFPLERKKEKLSKAEINDTIEESLENVGLLKAIDKTPAELSGGMQKRIALARTLILKPDIVLYDEPTTGLDPVTSKEISNLMLKMQDKYDISSITITHDISCVRLTADRIFIIKDKKLGVEGTYEDLENSDQEWVRSFFK
ncbi:MAG: ABC transporter ATP-binding protein [Candidatus Cyclobacteriaceae bacterium M3_2C_046]